MSLNAAWTELNEALKALRLRWDAVQPDWQDSVRDHFEANHWDPLEAQVVAALRAMDRLSPILIRAQRECSSHD
jgi:hypothetical protein